MSPPRERGAVPEIAAAILESDMHHLRSQADLDRRSAAERNRSVVERFERMEGDIAELKYNDGRAAESLVRIEQQLRAQASTQTSILEYVYAQRGALGLLKFAVTLLGLSGLGLLIKTLVEHAR